jgi:hypothetical protein
MHPSQPFGFPLKEVAPIVEGQIEAVQRGLMRNLDVFNQWTLGANIDDQEMRPPLITGAHVGAKLLAPLIGCTGGRGVYRQLCFLQAEEDSVHGIQQRSVNLPAAVRQQADVGAQERVPMVAQDVLNVDPAPHPTTVVGLPSELLLNRQIEWIRLVEGRKQL